MVYPKSLSTDLTSKRTSHKLAEQGRRNRINVALQELQALLPSPSLRAQEDAAIAAAAAKSEGPNSNNSKAAKVESATEYIKQLKRECEDKERMIRERDEEVGRLKREIESLKGSGKASAVCDGVGMGMDGQKRGSPHVQTPT